MKEPRVRAYNLITTRLLFTVSVIILFLTILFVWLFGLGQHRSLFENSIISTWILTTALYMFLFLGLYHGFKLKDNLGKINRRYKLEAVDAPLVSGSIDNEIEAIFFFILSIGSFIIILLNLAVILWMGILVFMAMLYWVYYRAIRFVFKKSPVCKGNIGRSLFYGLLFTLAYSVWFYLIIFGFHYFS